VGSRVVAVVKLGKGQSLLKFMGALMLLLLLLGQALKQMWVRVVIG